MLDDSTDITAHLLLQDFSARLADVLRPLEDAEEIKAVASQMLGQHLAADRVLYFEVVGSNYLVEHDYTRKLASLTGLYPVASFGLALLDMYRAGNIAVEADCWQNPDITADLRLAYDAVQVRAYIGVPLVKAGVFVAGLSVNQAGPRNWTRAEIALVEATAERTWAAVERARANRQLHASERLRRMALDATGLGVWSVNPDDNMLDTDERFRMIFQGSADAMTFEGAVQAIHVEDTPRILAAFNAAIRLVDPVPYAEEYRVIWPDGSEHWVLAFGRGHVLSGAQGMYLQSFDGTVQDITERKRLQKQTLEEQERARLLFEAMGEGAFIIEMMLDAAGRPLDYLFLHVNPAFERQSGLKDAVGKSALELVPNLDQHWIDFYGRVALTGQSEKIQQQGEAMDGRWWDVSAYRLGGPGSLKVAGLFTDITERKKSDAVKAAADGQVRLAYGLLRAVADGSSDAIAALGTDLRFTFINDSYRKHFFELFGVHVVIGNRLDESMAHVPADKALVVELWQRALKGERFIADVEFGDPKQDRRSWNICLYPLKDADGRVIGAAQNGVDVTERNHVIAERERLLIELQQQDQRKDEFLAMLSHELRNPLAPISNAVQLLRLQAGGDEKQLNASAIIDRQVGQLKHLVDDLLEVSRITTGRIQLRCDKVTLNAIIGSAMETIQPLMERRQHEVTVHTPGQPIWLDADAARLEQVLVNLLGNAAKYSDPGCRIAVTAAQEGPYAVLRVRDTGFGIAPDLLPRVFDLFTQAERSLARSEGGLGIGLALVKRLVELHGGRVEASSTQGCGSEFVVRLPAATAGVPGHRPSGSGVMPADNPAPGTKQRVLVVDDNIDAAESLTELLQLCGFDVRAAHDGLTALATAAEWRPGVVLLDIGLPEMDGYEVARLIRTQPALKDIVLVALTGYGQASDIERSTAAGFDHHLTKPADFDKIQGILTSA